MSFIPEPDLGAQPAAMSRLGTSYQEERKAITRNSNAKKKATAEQQKMQKQIKKTRQKLEVAKLKNQWLQAQYKGVSKKNSHKYQRRRNALEKSKNRVEELQQRIQRLQDTAKNHKRARVDRDKNTDLRRNTQSQIKERRIAKPFKGKVARYTVTDQARRARGHVNHVATTIRVSIHMQEFTFIELHELFFGCLTTPSQKSTTIKSRHSNQHHYRGTKLESICKRTR